MEDFQEENDQHLVSFRFHRDVFPFQQPMKKSRIVEVYYSFFSFNSL